jgi:hypothetical protein
MTHNLKTIYKICIDNNFISKDVTYKQFAEVIRECHIELSYNILRGYRFRPTGQLGDFYLVKDIRRGKTINWGASNKRKQEIIDAGETPLVGKAGTEESNNGKEWLMYFEDNDYFKWLWFKDTATKYLKNVKYYVFKPCTRNRRTIAKVIKEDSFITESYGTYK